LPSQVDHRHVELPAKRFSDFGERACLGHHLEVGLPSQQEGEGTAKRGVILDEQDTYNPRSCGSCDPCRPKRPASGPPLYLA